MKLRNAGFVRRAAMVAAGGIVLAAVAAGCTPLQEESPKPENTATAAPDSTSSTVDVSVYPGTSEDGFEGAIKDAAIGTCASDESGWHVGGTVTNSADVDSTYRVYVSLLDGETSKTLRLIQVDVPGVPVGETTEWTGALGTAASGDHTCVMRVERIPA